MEEKEKEFNILAQIYFLISFYVELGKNEIYNSDFFKNMKFQDISLKKTLINQMPIMDNQATALMFLYLLLVVPKEILTEKYFEDFKSLNKKIDSYKLEGTKSTYPDDMASINYIRHIRNAMAHVNVDFEKGSTKSERNIYFFDQKKDKKITYKCDIYLPMKIIAIISDEMIKILHKYMSENVAYYNKLQASLRS